MSKQPITRRDYLNAPVKIRAALLRYFSREDELLLMDIGSCEGEDSYRYSRLFPRATIHAFEPLPTNFARLQSLIREHPLSRVKAHRIALCDRNGTAELHVSSGSPPGKDTSDWDYGNKSSSLYAPGETLTVHEWLRFDRTVSVQTRTLAGFCADEGINQIDFIHMDVQGAELDVLKGAGDLIERIGLIWLEVEAVPLYQDQPLKPQIEAFMAENGFLKIKDTVRRVAGDQLYARANLPRRPLLARLWNQLRP